MNSQNVLLWLECRHGNICITGQCHHRQRSVPLQLIRQSDAASNRSYFAFLSGRHVAPDFIFNWIRSGLFGRHKSGSSYGWPWSLRSIHFWTAGSEWCAECQCRHGLRKWSWPAESIRKKNNSVISQHITKSLQMSDDTNNPCFKLTADNLQLNVLIRPIFEH